MKKGIFASLTLSFSLIVSIATGALAQIEAPPAPSAPKMAAIPAVAEKKLANGLTIAVAQKNTSPLVTVQFLVKAGASTEAPDKAGLANITADMLTKGTKTRSATHKTSIFSSYADVSSAAAY